MKSACERVITAAVIFFTVECVGGVTAFTITCAISEAVDPAASGSFLGRYVALAAMAFSLIPSVVFSLALAGMLLKYLREVPDRPFAFLLALPAATATLAATLAVLLAVEWANCGSLAGVIADVQHPEAMDAIGFYTFGIGITALVAGFVGENIVNGRLVKAQQMASGDSTSRNPTA